MLSWPTVLDLSIILLDRGVLSESVEALVMHVVRDLLVNHGNWRYQQQHTRWQIATKVHFELLKGNYQFTYAAETHVICRLTHSTINPSIHLVQGLQIVQNVLCRIIWPPGSQKFELSVLESVLYDSLIHDVLLQILSISAQALEVCYCWFCHVGVHHLSV